MANREPPVIPTYGKRSPLPILLLCVAVLLALLIAAGFVAFFKVQTTSWTRRNQPLTNQPQATPDARAVAAPASPFAELAESTVPGRYQWNDGNSTFFMVLYEDHSFMNRDGTTFPQYRWDIEPDGLTIRWQNTLNRFTRIERPGVYTGSNNRGGMVRMEKLPPHTAAQLAPPTPAASISFGNGSQTNGLAMAGIDTNLLALAEAGQVRCLQLTRPDKQRSANLAFQIADNLKDPPFTNAFVVVEFFDGAPPGGRWDNLNIQYDAVHGTNANSQPLQLSGSDQWQEATFYLARPVFANRQENGADFRITSARSPLFIRSVKLIKNPPIPETKVPSSIPVSVAK